MNIFENSYIKKVQNKIFNIFCRISYSQTGEDLIINFFREAKKLKTFRYLDIGANHPTKLNNTYFFYNRGFSGVSIEPNPLLTRLHSRIRKRDTVLQCGVGFDDTIQGLNYYMMEENALNTFSKEEAESLQINGFSKIISIRNVEVIPLNSVLSTYFNNVSPDFLNVDVEGLDLEILKSWDFDLYRPSIICLETVDYTNDASSKKNMEIIEFMKSHNYQIFADTYVNTIFYDSNKY